MFSVDNVVYWQRLLALR